MAQTGVSDVKTLCRKLHFSKIPLLKFKVLFFKSIPMLTSEKIPLLALLTLFFGISTLSADDITLKSGETYSGRITYEDDNIVKIEVSISASIKETKILATKDIAEIKKDDPADVEFKKLQGLVPTRSLMPASQYRSAIETGPDAYIRAFPDSKHMEEVQKIKATLEEEMDKVERGWIKIEDEWISPQDKIAFDTLIQSRIHFLRMEASAKAQNYNGYISAMREFEAIESKYYGSPALPKGVVIARQILPTLGRQLQNMWRDVEARNAEFERNKAALDEVARQQVEAARAREEANYQKALKVDKDAGIKWVRLNTRSKESIEGYIKLVKEELAKVQEYDVEALTAQAEKLVEVDKLIAEGQLSSAKSKLSDAAAMSGMKVTSKSKKSKKGSNSYIGALSSKLNEKLSKREAKEEAEAAAKKSEALTANLKKNSETEAPKEDAKESESEETATEEPAEEKQETASMDDFAALAAKSSDDEEEKESSKSSSSKKKPSKKDDDEDDEEEEKRSRPVADEGGGFNFTIVVWIGTALLVIAVVLMKVLGIGGKKEE